MAQAGILDKIYEIKPNLSIEEKVPYIFQKLFTLAASLSPLGGNAKESKTFTLSNYSSYLLNINRLLFWHKLPGGTDYLNQLHIKTLPLKKKGELLTQWIEEQGKNIIELDLDDGVGLTFLPPEIWQLSQLQTLNLSNNQLTTLSPKIGQLSNLQKLDISNNLLTAIPAEIGQLTKLQKLDSSNNLLTAIPAEIGQLTKLQKLDSSNNQLTIIRAEIGQLSRLQTLNLGDNHLTALPAQIGQLSHLQELDLSYNQLTIIPHLPKVKRFNIEGNPL
ncbi:hypothetical protein NEOC95_000080 [Neochlamydia sp. AcF95]|nr:hypothetical protein [Neochlamydia sp. AcF95]